MDLDTLSAMRPRLVGRFRVRFGDLAEDAVALVLARLALQIEAGGGAHIQPNYVWVACHNAAVSLARANARRPELDGGLHDTHAAPADRPDEGYSEATELALDAMTETQRAAVLLVADGYSMAEIGAQLGGSADAAKGLLKRARHAAMLGRPRSWEHKLRLAERELDRMMEEHYAR